MTFLVVTLSYMLVRTIYYHELPHLPSAGVHLTKFRPIFPSFQQKMPGKIFFVAMGGATAPPALPLATPMALGHRIEGKGMVRWVWEITSYHQVAKTIWGLLPLTKLLGRG